MELFMKKYISCSCVFLLLMVIAISCKTTDEVQKKDDRYKEKTSGVKKEESEIAGGKFKSQLISNDLYSYSYEVLLGNTRSPLLKAIKSQNFPLVSQLLQKNNNVNEVDSLGNNGVFYALASSHYAILNLLLSYNINADCANTAGKFPLLYAVDLVNLPIITILLDNGANINVKDANGLNVAMIAVYRKNIELLKFLRTKGAELTGYDVNGNSLLHIAVSNDDVPTIRFLLEQGLDVYYANNAGVRVLDLMKKSNNEKVKMFAKKYKN